MTPWHKYGMLMMVASSVSWKISGHGYLVNTPNCQLIIKPGGERQASTEFAGTNVEITQGARVLGSVIGSSEASKNFLKYAEIKYTKFGQTWSICSHLSPECLCMFDEGGLTEVELPRVLHLPWTGFWTR